jgi:hypothetical protein
MEIRHAASARIRGLAEKEDGGRTKDRNGPTGVQHEKNEVISWITRDDYHATFHRFQASLAAMSSCGSFWALWIAIAAVI